MQKCGYDTEPADPATARLGETFYQFYQRLDARDDHYVEHYGLTRREAARGRYEPVRPWHSWDSPHRVSNWMLFNLGRARGPPLSRE